MGHRDYVTVQISNENTQVQIHTPEMTGDKVVASAHSRYLTTKGWKGSRKNVSASYLTGYLAGKKAVKNGHGNVLPVPVHEWQGCEHDDCKAEFHDFVASRNRARDH